MKEGQKVLCTSNRFKLSGRTNAMFTDICKGELYEIEKVYVNKCGCGGDRIKLKDVEGDFCADKGFISAMEVVELSSKLEGKLTTKDFDV